MVLQERCGALDFSGSRASVFFVLFRFFFLTITSIDSFSPKKC